MENSSTADLAAELLVAPTALMQLTPADARVVVRYMQPHRIEEGTTFIKEGDTRDTDFMMLILDGEVTVETIVVSRIEPVTVTVLGRGSLVGEMGLLDGEPRAASCTASSPLSCAILSRQALEALMEDNPLVAAKLMLAVALRIAARLRDNADKLKMYVQLTQVMQQEISHRAPG
ncbi:MAG: cyclic nucleotide-binding domain-containing protein [Polaromonas sp.]|uniref:cyclic nucleotide-binding domain-containing protein n=1 Tax=Polaromonas sp. TaxID=1869339 RepID=UPI00272FAC7A|nr:cyclic nucleotide-binding domain-containing protein [Polaromonas sp.]MDP2255821.1 cyclic nucleotide-binding domain-containing protein [Polaromonas sp.]MDP3709434.1 cyclic nucleotide-binding domain-containing protein [Polaromonas sp.]